MSDNTTFFFGDFNLAATDSNSSDYGHTFGGEHDRRGASREDCNGILIHLLHRIDLRDPCVPIQIPGLNWLPLYYVFDFRANDLGYRLTSENSMETFFPLDDENVTSKEEWPGKNYPASFPRSDFSVFRCDYDPTDREDAYMWAGVFGVPKLSTADRQSVNRRVERDCQFTYDFTDATEEEYEDAMCFPFMQGKPNNMCLNPGCESYSRHGQLSVIALLPPEPVPGVQLWGGAGVQLIFEMCPLCYTIRSSNQCT